MEINLLTTNGSADFLTPPGVPPWDERKGLYAQAVRAAEPDIIGIQEATPRQLAFWQEQLPEFSVHTVEVVDPDTELVSAWREKYAKFGLPTVPSPYEVLLFYRTAAFEALDAGHWWLSPTPERPSIGFGNVAPRVVQWVHLKGRESGRELVAFNTHLDHRALDPMVALCQEKLRNFIARGLPLVFMGDFNINPTKPNFALLLNDGWQDSHPTGSNTGTFLYEDAGVPDGRIDHILYHGPWTPLAWSRIESPDPDKRLSDHRPVFARLRLEGCASKSA